MSTSRVTPLEIHATEPNSFGEEVRTRKGNQLLHRAPNKIEKKNLDRFFVFYVFTELNAV